MNKVLFKFLIQHSPNSKSLRLKVTRNEGLCIVVPTGFDEKKIPEILSRKKSWIANAMKRVGETQRFFEQESATHLPEEIKLTALGETWGVTYLKQTNRQGLWLWTEKRRLVISGDSFEKRAVIQKLKDWLRLRVRESLFPIAKSLASKHRLKVGGLMVKSQRTRWASCSINRNLSLNIKLLFLPPDIVRYVIVHELCHTVHMNHGTEFWRFVASIEPNYKVLDNKLRELWKSLPQWTF